MKAQKQLLLWSGRGTAATVFWLKCWLLGHMTDDQTIITIMETSGGLLTRLTSSDL